MERLFLLLTDTLALASLYGSCPSLSRAMTVSISVSPSYCCTEPTRVIWPGKQRRGAQVINREGRRDKEMEGREKQMVQNQEYHL